MSRRGSVSAADLCPAAPALAPLGPLALAGVPRFRAESWLNHSAQALSIMRTPATSLARALVAPG